MNAHPWTPAGMAATPLHGFGLPLSPLAGRMVAVTIPSPGGACFGAYHPAPGPAVLICPPFGHEALASARAWRDLSRRLAARGVASLRPDLPGTGDSAGRPDEPGRVAAWRGAIAACAAWLSARHGGQVALFGHRFGALLALDALGAGVPVHRLVLLDPPASGAAFARGLRGRARLEGFGPPPEGAAFLQAWGVPLAPETLADLAALPAPIPAGTELPPTLLVHPEGRPGEWPARLGPEVALAPFEGYEEFTRLEDLESAPPEAVLDRVAEFLAPAGGAVRLPALLPPPPLAAQLEFPGCSEVPLRFGPEDALFGILCRPDQPAPDTPAVLLPSTAALPRSGSARMWTELARRLAAQGITSLRFDMAGLGESEGDLGEDRFAAAYHPDRVADLRAALDAMEAQGFGRAVVIGLCSGAYNALMAADSDHRIAGVIAANPQFLNVQRVLTKAALNRYPRSRIPLGELSSLALAAGARGLQALAIAPLRSLRNFVRTACPRPLRDRIRSVGAEERLARAHLTRLVGRGCALHLVFAAGDIGHIRLCRAFGEQPLLPRGARLSVRVGPDHVFAARQHRAWLLDLATAKVLEMAGLAPAAAPPQEIAA